MKFIIVHILILFLLSTLQAQTIQSDLESQIKLFQKDIGAVSVSIVLVNKQGITFKKALGWANIEKNESVTFQHIFPLGSVSKLFTGTMVLQLIEQGNLDLDTDVNQYLPFKMQNPRFPNEKITIRMLLTHTSSIGDRQLLQDSLYGEGDPSMSLKDLTEAFFSETGRFYKPENYLDFEPGKGWEYSNWNFVLLGYIIERIVNEPFNEYSRKVLLEPLEMYHSGWFLSEVDTSCLATLYQTNGLGQKQTINPKYSWPGYTDGNLRCNIEETSHFLQMILNEGAFHGKQLLKKETVQQMLQPQGIEVFPYPDFKDMGLVWHIYKEPTDFYNHSGSPTGTMIYMGMIPEEKAGFVAFVTGIDVRNKPVLEKWKEFRCQLIEEAIIYK